MSNLFHPDVVKYNYENIKSHEFYFGDWVVHYDEEYQLFSMYFNSRSQYIVFDKNLEGWYVSFEVLFQRKNTNWSTFHFEKIIQDYVPTSIKDLFNNEEHMRYKDYVHIDKRILSEYFTDMHIAKLLQEEEFISLQCIKDDRSYMLGLNITVDSFSPFNFPFKWFIHLYKLNAKQSSKIFKSR